MTIEICCDNIEVGLLADKYKAKRIELCSALSVGGLTPSYGLIEQCVSQLNAEVHVMIRPRPGNFVYTISEIELMLADIRAVKEIGAHGVVFGCLNANNELDFDATEKLSELAIQLNLEATFHRAIDFVPNINESIEQLIQLKIHRILTSGGKPRAIEGIETIQSMVRSFGNKIQIMAGSGINDSNAKELIESNISALHFTAHKFNDTETELGMGSKCLPNEEKLTAITQVINSLSC